MEANPGMEIKPNAKRTPRRPKRERRFIRRTAILSALLALLLAFGAFLYAQYRPQLLGKQIDRAIAEEDFAKALQLIAQLEDADAAAEYGDQCAYAMAQQSFSEGNYQAAADRFAALGDYQDAKDMGKRCAYEKAAQQFEKGDYAGAAEAFSLLGAFEDAAERAKESRYNLADALEKDGDRSGAADAFLALGDFRDARDRLGALAVTLTGESDPEKAIAALTSLSPEEQQALLIRNTLSEKLKKNVVAAGFYHTVAVKDDGTVLACGRNDEGQCDVSAWTDVAAVDAGAYHTVALKKDGTALAAGRNGEGQCDVLAWTDLIAVAAGDYTTYGLQRDGTVVFAGFSDVGEAISSWTGITEITAGAYALVGLSGGTAYATHPSARSASMTGLIAAGVSTGYAVGLRADGTLFCTSDALDLSDLPEGVAVSCASTYVALLGGDGALHAYFFRESDAFDLAADALVIAFDAGNLHLAAVTEDGRVVCFGQNGAGQCDTGAWRRWD